MIGFVGEDGQVKLVNPEWERTMGWTLKELQEQTWTYSLRLILTCPIARKF